MGWWNERVLPRLIDRLLDSPEVNQRRRLTCSGLAGRVLEIGFGSGLNVPFYPAAVDTVLAVEPSDLAWELSAERRAAVGGSVEVVRAGLDGQRLELPDDSADAALSTYTLCTIPQLPPALAQIRRVLRPGGELHFLEHGLAPDDGVRGWQRRLNPLQGRVAGGCRLDTAIGSVLTDAGFELVELDTGYGETRPRAMSFLYRGRARTPV